MRAAILRDHRADLSADPRCEKEDVVPRTLACGAAVEAGCVGTAPSVAREVGLSPAGAERCAFDGPTPPGGTVIAGLAA